jgi:hypothetical protein
LSTTAVENLQLIAGCDANAHHIVWGSTGINPRGSSLLEYLVSANLNILNKGNEPTFVVSNRQEVTDLTLGTDKVVDLVSDWHVSDEISLSDHRYIQFQVSDIEIFKITYRNPKRTNWESYREDLKANLRAVPRVVHSVRIVELAVDLVQQAILSSYHKNCPARMALSPRKVPWWNKELSRLKASTRRLFNKAKKTGNWEPDKMALTSYHIAIRKAKRSSWREYCRGIENVPDRARLMRIMANQSAKKVGSIKLPNGYHTQAGETVEIRQGQPNLGTFIAHREDWELSKRIIDQSKIKLAINTFKPFKLAGTDELVPALLQQGVEYLTTHLCKIFRACLARGYIPIAWRQVKVTFIPKPGKASYTEAKAYCPISLSSFTLKTMEKLVDTHIRDEIMRLRPLHRYQFAYQPGKSTENALNYVITCIEEAVENKEVTLGAF